MQALVAMEEQTKKKAEVKKARYKGPMLRFLSKAVDGEERVSAFQSRGEGAGFAVRHRSGSGLTQGPVVIQP